MNYKNVFYMTIAVLFAFMPFQAYGSYETSEKDQYDFAYVLYLNNNFNLAENLFKQFEAEFPETAVAGNSGFMIAESQYNNRHFKDALYSYLDIIEKYPQIKNKYKKEIYYRLAECYYQIKDYQKSIQYLQLLLADYPDSYLSKDAYLLLGEDLFLNGEYDEALNATAKLEKYSNYEHFDYVYYLTGRIYYEKSLISIEKEKNANEAIKFFNRVNEEFPESKILSHSEYWKANVYYSLGDYNKAISITNDILEKDKDEKFKALLNYFKAWNYYMLGDYNKAIEIYDAIIKNYEGEILSIWSEYKKGLCYEALSNKDKAMEQYNKVINKYPNTIPSAYAQYAIAYYYYKTGDYYTALREYQKVVDEYNVDEITRAAYFMTADIYTLVNEFKKAEEMYGKIEQKYKGDYFIAEYLKAWSLYKEGEYNDAITIYNNIISSENAPEDMKIKSTLKIGDNYFELNNFTEADKYYDEITDKYLNYPDISAEAYYGKAWILYKNNKYEDALKVFSKSNSTAKDNEIKFKAKFMKANTLYTIYKFDEALNIYSGIMNDKESPRDISNESMFYAAWCYYRKENFDLAINLWKRYRDLIKDSVKKAEAQYRIGWSYFRKNDFDQAINEFKVIIDKYQSTHLYQEAILKVGDSYYNKHDYNTAIQYYTEIVDKFPTHYRVGEALYGIQWSYYQLGNYDKAIELSKKFVDKYPESSFTPEIQYRIAEHYYNIKKYETAVDEFKRFIEKYSKHELMDNAYYWLGMSYFNINKFSESINTMKILIKNYPSTPFADKALFKTANSYYKLHEYQNAIDYYKQLIDTHKDSEYIADAYFNIAMSYKRLSNVEEAKKWYQKLIVEYKNSELLLNAYMNLGYIYQDEKSYDKAIELFSQVVDSGKQPSTGAEAQYWIADSYNLKGDTETAVKEYINVYKKFPGEEMWAITALSDAGKLYEKNGEIKKAVNVYKKILDATKNQKWLDTTKKRIELLDEEYKISNPVQKNKTVKRKKR